MPHNTTDEEIAASVRQAEELLNKLSLTGEERAWAKEQSKIVFNSVTEALLISEKMFGQIRAVAVPAAMAYALSIARDWAAKTDDLAKGR